MADNGSPIHFRRSHAFDSPRDRESTEDGIAWLLTAHPRAAGPISDVLLAGGEISRWLESGRQVLEALIPGGFCLADADFVPVTWNERFLDVLSCSGSEMKSGERFSNCLEAAGLLRSVRDALSGREDTKNESKPVQLTGFEKAKNHNTRFELLLLPLGRWLLHEISPDSPGRGEGAASADARLAASAMTTLMHDLRQSLQALRLLTTSVPSEPENTKWHEHFDAVRHLVEESNNYLSVMASLDPYQKDGVRPRQAEIFLPDFLHQHEVIFRSQADLKGIGYIIHSAPLTVLSDPLLLGRIMGNAITNAIEHTSGGEIRVDAWQDGPEAVIEVIDSGSGIPQAELARIFGDGDNTPAPGGGGLGLYIIKMLADRLGHPLSVTSEPERGTRLRLRVSRARASPPPLPESMDRAETTAAAPALAEGAPASGPATRRATRVLWLGAGHRPAEPLLGALSQSGIEVAFEDDLPAPRGRPESPAPDVIILEERLAACLPGVRLDTLLAHRFRRAVPVLLVATRPGTAPPPGLGSAPVLYGPLSADRLEAEILKLAKHPAAGSVPSDGTA